MALYDNLQDTPRVRRLRHLFLPGIAEEGRTPLARLKFIDGCGFSLGSSLKRT